MFLGEEGGINKTFGEVGVMAIPSEWVGRVPPAQAESPRKDLGSTYSTPGQGPSGSVLHGPVGGPTVRIDLGRSGK